ncbi:hypothetical protein AB0D57_27360 [Streptomyces sp. NPDC048275]|uniref:hypothetical protein n=1 Tax=Streptomyces sp. NPDC048275 TaxID=3155629 RepID=UPI0033D8B7F5
MAADAENTPHARRAAPLAPLPNHRNVDMPWWQELWRRHAHLTTPLRARRLECDIEFGLSAHVVRVSLCCPALKMPMKAAFTTPTGCDGDAPPVGVPAGRSSARCRFLRRGAGGSALRSARAPIAQAAMSTGA